MNRTAMSALCVAACLISVVRAKKRMRGAVGAFALEQIERVFDMMERRLRRAA